jgi:hypothetical protein
MKTPGSAQGAASARTRVLRRLSLSLVALAFAVFAASALAGSHAAMGAYQISGSITNADAVVINPYYRTLKPTCTSGPQPPPQNILPGNFHYKIYRFRNISHTQQCVHVSLAVYSGTAIATVFSPFFDPSSPGANNHRNTSGLGAGQNDGFEWQVSYCDITCPEPNIYSPFEVMVWESTPGGATYTLLVEGIGIIMTGGTPTAAAALQSFRASSAPKGVLVRWKTRSEHEALGFNVYRGDKKKVRLTRSIVRASGGGHGHSYSFLDRSARKGKVAPYYLEVVQRGGSKIMFGPAAH